MIIVYHPQGATLSAYALRQWLVAALAAVPADTEISTPPASGVILDMGLPNYPWQFEPAYLADDRETQAGKSFSRLRAIRRQGTLNFSKVPSSVIPDWRAWHSATQGGRIPFLVQLPDLSALFAIAPGGFPLALISLERWAGALNLTEAFPSC